MPTWRCTRRRPAARPPNALTHGTHDPWPACRAVHRVGLGGEGHHPIARPSRANPSRGGDAKPGASVPPEVARLPGRASQEPPSREARNQMKANLARFMLFLSAVASMALTVSAGPRPY